MTALLTAPEHRPRLIRWVSYALAAIAALAILELHLLGALVAGLAVHQLTTRGAARLKMNSHGRARGILVAALSVVIIGLLLGAGLGLSSFLHSDSANLPGLLDKVNGVLVDTRSHLPPVIANLIPADMTALRETASSKLHEHAEALQGAGKAALTGFVHIFIGLVLGAMVALSELKDDPDSRPLARALKDRASHLATVFGQIVSAQLKISLLNTALSALFLLVVLPLIGAPVPLAKTLVLLTFVLGLLPVAGNLLSNTLVVLVSLSVAPWVALVSLGFLIVIHKLEYFLNARIVGGEIDAKAWELLLAMLAMEAMFGLPGVIAAPIFYAWVKRELRERALV